MAVFFAVWEIIASIAEAGARSRVANAESIVIILICGILISHALFTSNVRWTIRKDEIRIDKDWIYERREVELIRSGEITKIKIAGERDEESGDRFYIRLWLSSGEASNHRP